MLAGGNLQTRCPVLLQKIKRRKEIIKMASYWMGKYSPNTFYYGIEGENKDIAVHPPSLEIQKLMNDPTITFTGLGEFPTEPTDQDIIDRINLIRRAKGDRT
jgi:hypothetical protein